MDLFGRVCVAVVSTNKQKLTLSFHKNVICNRNICSLPRQQTIFPPYTYSLFIFIVHSFAVFAGNFQHRTRQEAL